MAMFNLKIIQVIRRLDSETNGKCVEHELNANRGYKNMEEVAQNYLSGPLASLPKVKNDGTRKAIRTSTRLKVRKDRSAAVLVSIVILFLITHCYRLALKIYEVALPNTHTMEEFETCFSLKR